MKRSATKLLLVLAFASSLVFPAVAYSAPEASEQVEQLKAIVVKVEGDVLIRSRGSLVSHDAKANEILSAGDQIETKEKSRIEIRIENGNVINLKPKSKLTLKTLTRDLKTGDYENLLEVDRGNFRAKVDKIKGKSRFEVKSPTAVACVRGTIMYLIVFSDSTTAFFEEGVGFVTNPFSGQSFDVNPGNIYQIDENGNVTGPVIPTPEQLQDMIGGWDVGAGGEGYSGGEGGDDLGGDTGSNYNFEDAMDDIRNSWDAYSGSGANNTDGGTTTSGGTGITSETDTDGDGLTDEREVNTWQTDPAVSNADADADLIPDVEDAFFTGDLNNTLPTDRNPNYNETRPEYYGSRDNIRNEIKDIIDRNALRDDITDMIADGNIRNLDARMEQVTDAQTGKVLKDRQGNRVRIEQYVLRPDSNTVQLLNISLRTQEAGSLAGLNTLDWTTRFSQSLNSLTGQQLRDLPWNEYLLGSPVKYGTTQPSYYPDWTQVRFDNPQGNTFMEKKDYAGLTYTSGNNKWHQLIDSDQVSFNQGTSWYSFSTNNIDGGSNPDGFRVNPQFLGSEYDVDARFYVISDSGTLVNAGNKSFDNIWGFLAVNMPGTSSEAAPHANQRNIGDNNLEIRLSSKFGGSQVRDIDLIYIPWNRQTWHTDHNWGD